MTPQVKVQLSEAFQKALDSLDLVYHDLTAAHAILEHEDAQTAGEVQDCFMDVVELSKNITGVSKRYA